MNAASRQPSTLPADALLAVDGVSLEYRTRSRVVRATQRVSFEVDPADRFVLLGPSGCGKSTLLKAVAGFITPSEGEIRLQGQAVRAPGPDRIVVFQEFDQLPPWKTVRQNVLFPLRVSGQVTRDEAERRADECLEKVGLAGFAEAYPHTLSGGMKARVAIARALAMQPKILLLSPHPGRVRAEVHGHPFGLHSLGGEPLQAAARRIHRLLFDEGGEPTAAATLDFADIRLAH
ncbi:ABC transporter ATP-binding protein [Pseudomonas aeruginosa]|nr:ATP-binding cassette domain-containing protein [Pseudomonas aeruginosa]EKV3012050.1 ATP-binding cassette domain-containing protein [Pseudomonas aeruginosa]EKW6550388.1 ATP-binding cassette domain-containing protein [Pseudomonas aeruginosa]EMA4528672.1 ATP-binding cassette domain-containing protein [Pseudomonas aeruginosa]MBH9291205.1 ATP-binding cassette domain-containing protein [Pseudomonas aeruginosa]